ncbi:MAG TPA: lysophospholipid acyltransferase family protein [Thermoanaerobaculia bacterium]|nr:lysophospholipid acyltransferase family protein [Thermoanaerobaculia bacterium]
MRRFLTAVFRRLLKIFYSRIEVVGLENIPDSAPVVVAVNHPNGLVDPLFVLTFMPRRVSFLAKASLFRMPVIGYFVRAFDSIPVYRKQDNVIGTNAETFERAREILEEGGAIAIFPEGTTHSDAHLRELKTGAARIALGSSLQGTTIVPAGIYYTAKQTFRSTAMIAFGEPIQVGVSRGGMSPEVVRGLTARIEERLAALTLQADSHAALELIGQAEDIFFTSHPDQPLSEELELRRRFIAAYHDLRLQRPARLARLESEIRRFTAELGEAGLELHELVPRVGAGTVVRLVLLFPIAAAGAVVHYPSYRLVDLLTARFSRGVTELTATVKFLSALAVYPLTWLLIAALAWRFAGGAVALATLAALPFLGYAALRVLEDTDDAVGRTRALLHRLFSSDAHAELVARRRAIRREIAALASELDVPASGVR